jgi:hypothetical protein
MGVLDILVNGLGWLTSIYSENASQIYSIISGIDTLMAGASALLVLVSGLAAWMVWTINAVVLAFKVSVEGLPGLLTGLVVSMGAYLIDGVSAWAYTNGVAILQHAAAQADMPIWDWCNGPGKGKCPPEPNNGMPE